VDNIVAPLNAKTDPTDMISFISYGKTHDCPIGVFLLRKEHEIMMRGVVAALSCAAVAAYAPFLSWGTEDVRG
jgi:hypothetical protein